MTARRANRIERYLRKVDGIEVANVNLATERATVVARPEVTVEQIWRQSRPPATTPAW